MIQYSGQEFTNEEVQKLSFINISYSVQAIRESNWFLPLSHKKMNGFKQFSFKKTYPLYNT